VRGASSPDWRDGPVADGFYIENISLPPEVEKALDKADELGMPSAAS